jgi:SAM-dependent methyltransferase
MNFFSEFPRFFLTSSIGTEPERLNRCYDVLIERNGDLIRGRRILDLGSHDGRWAFAAVKLGAVHVTGIEMRQHLVRKAEETFRHYGIPAEQYSLICGDFFDTAHGLTGDFDTVFCFGVFYHTLRHAELLGLISRQKASAVIIDTAIVPSSAADASIRLVCESASEEGNGPALPGAVTDEAIAGVPTLGAVVMLLEYFGYTAEVVDWWQYLARARDLTDLGDYAAGERATIIGRR